MTLYALYGKLFFKPYKTWTYQGFGCGGCHCERNAVKRGNLLSLIELIAKHLTDNPKPTTDNPQPITQNQ